MIAVLLLAAIACVNGAALDTCTVGSWGEWSECKSSKHCPSVKLPLKTASLPASRQWDFGREQMQRIKKLKTESRQAKLECIDAGTCKEHLMRPLAGTYACDAETGLAGDIPCRNIRQRSFSTFAQMGYDNPRAEGNDIWGWTDPETRQEYAIMGFTGGTAFVDVTDADNPVYVGFMPTATTTSIWRDIKVIGNYAYVGAESRDHGLQVFDLTRLRGRTTIENFEPDAVNNDFGNSHNIVANSDTNFIYVVGATQGVIAGYPSTCDGGLFVVDVHNPLQPTTVGCFGGDGYVHDAQCVIYRGPDTRYFGKEICFCFNEDSLTMVDVSDKSQMTMISKRNYTNVAYTHQGWLTEDHQVILLDDELDENEQPSDSQFTKTYVWDVSDLEDPQLRSIFQSSERSIDHNQYIIGDYTFQANYESGLRILHLNRATYELTSVAYFDVYPSRTTADWFGSWSVYPYFASGNIVISSIDYGLFVVTPDWAAIEALVKSGQTYAEQTRTRPIVSTARGAVCPALVETKSCSAPVFC